MSNAANVGQSLSEVRKQIDVGAYNLERLGDPSARRIDTSLKVDQLGDGSYRTSMVETRVSNPLQEKAYIEQVTKLENANTYTEFLGDLQSVIGGEKDAQVSRLVKTIDSFFAQAKILESSNGQAMRQAFIDKAEDVSLAITSAAEKIVDLRFEADKRLKQSAISVNSTLKAIFNLNQQMLISSNPLRLFDQRDSLIRDLAQNFDIKITYGNSGTVNIQSKINSEMLVGSDYYSQFSYLGAPTADAIIEGSDYPPIMIHQFDKAGQQTHSAIFAERSDSHTLPFSGGKWSALIDLRDKVLPAAGEKIKSLSKNFAEQLNTIHNNGSPFPPKGFFESSMFVSNADILEWGEPFTIHFVTKEGDQLRGGAGRLNPVTIDMKNLQTSSASGKASVADLIKELNEKLDLAPSRERAAIGTINDANGVPLTGEFLLNNIQLRAKGPINLNDNSFVFDLDLQGNSHFGSNIEILGVSTTDVGGANVQNVAVDQLPPTFRLEKDTNTATGQNIKVEGATVPRVINLRLRITGDNGTVSEGTVSFPVDAAAGINSRISYNSSIAGSVTGDFANPAGLTGHSGIARAMLVDEHGTELGMDSNQIGKFVIATNDDSYRLVVQGGKFSAQFGFNNLFEFDDQIGRLKVNQEIINDLSKLSLGRADRDAGIATAHTVGDTRAEATLLFGGAALNNADTVTIHGVTFTFVNALAVPANPHEILVAEGLGGANGLISKVNTHPELKNLVEASLVGATVTIKAKAAGTSGNAITVASNLVGGATIDLNASGAANGAVAGNLINGTDKVESSPVFSYTMKPGNQQVLENLSSLQTQLVNITEDEALPNTITTLSGLATIVTGLLSDSINNAKMESDVAAIVLERTDAQIKNDLGINKEQEYLRVLDLSRLASTLAHLLNILQNTTVKIEDIMFSR
ncbi:MAG: hypothetical protein Tsb006_1100 [Rickettsiaceae bacterium]